MAINPTHVVMGRNIAASGSLAGEMKVAAISGSTGLTLNQMLIKLDDNATADVAALIGDAASAYNTLGKIEDVIIANDAALRGDAASAYNQLGKIEDIIIALQADVDANEVASDSAESTLTTNLTNLSGGLDGRLDVLEAGAGSAGSVAKAQADAQAFATAAIADLVDSAPGALNTLNELAAALNDDASFHTTITNMVAANEVHVDRLVSLSGMAKDSAHLGTFTGGTIADNVAIKVALQSLETKVEAVQTDVDGNESDADAAIAANEVHIDNFATLSGVAKDAVNFGTFTGQSIQDNRVLKVALQDLETAIEGNETEENGRLDKAGGFHVENSAGVYKLGWGSGKPRVSFSISGADVTMSVDVE